MTEKTVEHAYQVICALREEYAEGVIKDHEIPPLVNIRTGQEQDCHYYELTGNVGLEHMMAENIKKKVNMSEYLKKVTKEELYERL